MTEALPERIRKVPCPACGADAGAYCLGIYGRPIRDTHVDRRMAAKHAGFVAVTKRRDLPMKRSVMFTMRMSEEEREALHIIARRFKLRTSADVIRMFIAPDVKKSAGKKRARKPARRRG